MISSFCESIGKFTGLLGVIPMNSISSCSFVTGFSVIEVGEAFVVVGASTVVPNKYNLFNLYIIIFINLIFFVNCYLPGEIDALCGIKTITVLPIVVVKSKNPYTVCVI